MGARAGAKVGVACDALARYAADGGGVEACEQVQQRRLARARRADDGDARAGFDAAGRGLQRDRRGLAGAERASGAVGGRKDLGHASTLPSRSRSSRAAADATAASWVATTTAPPLEARS